VAGDDPGEQLGDDGGLVGVGFLAEQGARLGVIAAPIAVGDAAVGLAFAGVGCCRPLEAADSLEDSYSESTASSSKDRRSRPLAGS